jgi:CHAT domain-containing protein/tetratricopeptide (TPR) repeat protein
VGEDFQIGQAEAAEHLPHIEKAFGMEDPDARRPILVAATLRFGIRFGWSLEYLVEHATGSTRERLELLSSEALGVLLAWVGGEQLSDRADEDERRARAALDLLDQSDGMARLASMAVGKLPENHPLRDETRIAAAMERQLAALKADNDLEGLVLTIMELLTSESLSTDRGRALVAEALELGKNDALEVDARRRATRAAMLWHFERSVRRNEDRGVGVPRDEDEHARFLVIMHELTSQLRRLGTTPQDELSIGAALFEAGEFEPAAETLAKQVDARSEVWRTAAWLEAAVRGRLGHDTRAITVLESIVALEEEDYILAVEPSDVAESGQRLTKDAVALALAYARQQRWADALATIERTKSPRLRHLAKLRTSKAGRALLVAEARVASLRRGVPGAHVASGNRDVDPLGRDLTAEIRALEDYRAQRPDLTLGSIAPPTVAQASAALAEHEGIVSLGVDRSGLMMIGIVRGDRDAPSWTELRPELTYPKVLELFQDGDEPVSGWLLELAARAPVRPRPSLERLLRNVDDAFGASLARFAAAHDLRRLTVVPHRLLHGVPYWALASLAQLDVQVAPSLAHWMSWRTRAPRLAKSAVVVGNPTLDLDFAMVEAVSVATTLSALGYEARAFVETAATEEAVRDAAKTAGILHFAGHGFSRPTEPLLCSLLMHPSPRWQWPAEGDPLRRLAAAAERWSPTVDFVRHTDTATGRVIERYDEFAADELVERQLDYSAYGTLWGEYYQGRLLRLAELWTTSDILIDDSLEQCALAFLCACESGRADLSLELDEAVGIPSSLEIGGVDTVICTLWPVADLAALVFARLFYAELGAAHGTLDARAMVKTCRERLAAMAVDAVVDLLLAMQAETTDSVVKAHLRAAQREVLSMPDPPFAHPFYWGAFTCYGVERLALGEP